MDRLSAFAKQIGFSVNVGSDVIEAVGVPCRLGNETIGTCSIAKSYDPTNGRPTVSIGDAVHAVRIATDLTHDGRVYHADGNPIGNYLSGDDKTWSFISLRKGSQSDPLDDESATEVIYRYAKQIVGATLVNGHWDSNALAAPWPFNIPNTFEKRAELGPVQDRIRSHRVAIIGLGGTGSYILDLIAKTPVVEIHLLDCDKVEWHNFMRAPGAPNAEDIESCRDGILYKVDYYLSKYTPFRQGIHAHSLRVDNASAFTEFLTSHAIDYAFVCIDQLTDSDSPRQDAVYTALSEARVPFIDSGVSITLEDRGISGSVTTGAYAAGSLDWKIGIPEPRTRGRRPGYSNVQLPEVNALAGALAVMEWRRRTEQYISQSSSFLHKFRIDGPRIVST